MYINVDFIDLFNFDFLYNMSIVLSVEILVFVSRWFSFNHP